MFKTFEKGIYEGNPPEEEVSEEDLLKELSEAEKKALLENLPGFKPGDEDPEEIAQRMEEESHTETPKDSEDK